MTLPGLTFSTGPIAPATARYSVALFADGYSVVVENAHEMTPREIADRLTDRLREAIDEDWGR